LQNDKDMFNSLKRLLIKETIWINVLRGICAGIMLLILTFFMPKEQMAPLQFRIFFPIAYPFIILFFFLITQILSIFSLGGIGRLTTTIVAIIGDPLLFILHKVKPEWVPIEKLNFLNFNAFFLIYENDLRNIIKSSIDDDEIETCLFKGRVIADTETTVLGFNYPTKSTIFSIDNDWKVSSNGKTIGWIDKSGQIRKGMKGDTDATMSLGKIIGKISDNLFYVDNQKVGEFVKW
jgi:hypothetical protein